MKKLLLSLATIALISPAIVAQNPSAVYVHTWNEGTLDTAIDPEDILTDPQLTYNSTTNCWEGEVIDWPKMTPPSGYNAKKFYSVENDVITYYAVPGALTQLDFGKSETLNYSITADTQADFSKGFVIAFQGTYSIADVKIALNLESNEVTFTKFESGMGTDIPTLQSVVPENGSLLVPDADGNGVITLTFTGEVTSMEAICEGTQVSPVSNANGTVWTLTLSPQRLENAISEADGTLNLKFQNVYAGSVPLTFEGGNTYFNLVYTVEGYTMTAILDFEGETGELNVYKSPFYTVGNELEIIDDTLEATYNASTTYLFTAPEGYSITIASDVESDDETNWVLGTDWSVKTQINPDNQTSTEENYLEGPTLTLYPGSNGATFTITVTKSEDAGINSISSSISEDKIYNLNGIRVNPSEVKSGIYIVNGKKVIVK